MSDEQPTDTWLQANAYLDGALAGDEAALAEADPAVMADVARLVALRSALASVEPPDSHAREAAIAAALAEFDTGVPLRSRPRSSTWLGVAAAIVAVGLLGVLISRVSLGGDDDDSAAIEATTDGGDAARITEAAAATALDATAEEAAVAAIETTAPMLAVESDAAEAPAAEAIEAPEATDAPAATAAPAGVAGGTGEADSAAPAFVVLADPIDSEEALELVGRQLLARTAAGAPAAVPDTPCDDDPTSTTELLGEGALVESGSARRVLVAVDHLTDTVVAIDPTTCVVIVTGR